MTQPVDDPGFVADLTRAASVWRGNPVVPALYALIAAGYALIAAAAPEPAEHCLRRFAGACPVSAKDYHPGLTLLLAVLFLPLLVFQVGLAGTMRVWYARRFEGDSMTMSEAWNLSWRFLGRFILLGLMFAAILMPLEIVGFAMAASQNSQTPLLIAVVGGTVVADILFTFATTGLALYNPSPWMALKGGLRLLRTSWPQCAAYALLPPLAVLLTARFASAAIGHDTAVALAFVAPFLTLLCAGAATSFALRRYPARGRTGTLEDYTAWSSRPVV